MYLYVFTTIRTAPQLFCSCSALYHSDPLFKKMFINRSAMSFKFIDIYIFNNNKRNYLWRFGLYNKSATLMAYVI